MTQDQFHVKQIVDPDVARHDLGINEYDLSLSMMKQAGLFAYYSTMAAEAQLQFDKMEQLEEIILARLDKKVRDDAVNAGSKITEAQVKAQISIHPRNIQVRTAVNKARMVASIAKSTADSFRHRRDMLTQLSFNSREERKGELRLHGSEEAAASARENRRQIAEGILSGKSES